MAKQPNICFLRMYVCMVVRECLSPSTIQNKLKCLDTIDMRENFLGKFLCLRIFGKMAGLLKTISIRINLLEKYSFVVVVRIFCRFRSRATNFLFLKHVQIQKSSGMTKYQCTIYLSHFLCQHFQIIQYISYILKIYTKHQRYILYYLYKLSIECIYTVKLYKTP